MKFPIQAPAVVRDHRVGPVNGVKPADECVCRDGECPKGKNARMCPQQGTCICCGKAQNQTKGNGGACKCA